LTKVKEQERGDKADQLVVDAAFNQAAALAEKVAPYRHARLSAMKLVATDQNKIRDDITAAELRQEILADMRRLGLFDDLAAVPVPEGTANREVPAKDGTA
jgi:hypothetical protein